jgi:hypothetical protein
VIAPPLKPIIYIGWYDEFSETVSYNRSVDVVYFPLRSRLCFISFGLGLLRDEGVARGRQGGCMGAPHVKPDHLKFTRGRFRTVKNEVMFTSMCILLKPVQRNFVSFQW